MARRYLGMGTAEWDALAWWEQRMYVEGYVDEGLVEERSSGDPTVVSERVNRSGGTTVTEREHRQVFGSEPGELAAFGLTETTLEK